MPHPKKHERPAQTGMRAAFSKGGYTIAVTSLVTKGGSWENSWTRTFSEDSTLELLLGLGGFVKLPDNEGSGALLLSWLPAGPDSCSLQTGIMNNATC